MTFSVNGRPLLVAAITEPIRGAWTADVQVDSTEDLGKSVTIELGSSSAQLVGTAFRSGVFQGRWVARVVGGKGGLSTPIGSRYYSSVPAKTVVSGVLDDAGEQLDGTVAASVLGTAISRWMRPAGEPHLALDDLANELGVGWRVTRAGKVWLGTETWPEISAPGTTITQGPSTGTVLVAPTEAALVRPGVTYSGRRVSHVVTTVQDGALRQTLWLDEAKGDRLLAVFGALVKRVLGKRIDYLAPYPATVVKQASDGLSLEVLPDDVAIRGAGMSRVQIRHGSPGWGVRVPRGTRITVKFDAGDPSRPYVADWEPGEVDLVTFAGGTQGAARQGDMTLSGGPATFVIFGPPIGAPPNNAVVVGVPYQMIWLNNGPASIPSPYLTGVVSSGSTKMKIGG